MIDYHVISFITGIIVGAALMVYKINKTEKAYWT